jgi:1,2-phenylacetyl-CoA epoxidase catalytic subunit
LERLGYRELAAAHLFATGVRLAPTLDDKQMFARHCLDELGHFEQIAARLEELGGGELLARVSPRVLALPMPSSWLEMVVVGSLFDRAVYHQLRAYDSAPDARVKELAQRVIADEQEHLAANQAALADLAGKEPEFSARVSESVGRWLPLALECFDGPESADPPCSRAPHTSLEAARAARREYLRRVRRTLEPSGVPSGLFAELDE